MRTIDKSKVVGAKFVDSDGTVFRIDHAMSRSNSLRIIEFHSIDEIDNFIRDLKKLKQAIKDGFFTKE